LKFFRQLKESITSPEFYKTIYDQSLGKTFKYLLLFFLVTYIIGGSIFSVHFFSGVNTFIAEVQSKMPEFVLANGRLEVKGEQPVVFEDNNTTIVIDTTGKTTEESLSQKTSDYILVTKEQVFSKQGVRQQSYRFSDFPVDFNKDMLMEKLPYLKSAVILIGVFAFIFGLFGRVFWALILSLGALVLNASMKTKLKYAQLFTVSVYALTLPIVLEFIKDQVDLTISLFSVVYWGLGLVYVYLALKAIKQTQYIEPIDPELKA